MGSWSSTPRHFEGELRRAEAAPRKGDLDRPPSRRRSDDTSLVAHRLRWLPLPVCRCSEPAQADEELVVPVPRRLAHREGPGEDGSGLGRKASLGVDGAELLE